MKYTVTGKSVALHGGVLVLSKEQAEDRAHNLTDLGKGRYRVNRGIEFKQGEVFGYEGDLPKGLGVEPVESANADGGNTGPSVKDLKEELTKRGIDFSAKDKKDALQKLLDDDNAKIAAAETDRADVIKQLNEKAIAFEQDASTEDLKKLLEGGQL
jgi:hypothetical protein